jgi:hypothetical protein
MFCDIYLYTLCYYICCLLGACMRCTWLCPLKPGVTQVSSFLTLNAKGEKVIGPKQKDHTTTPCFFLKISFCKGGEICKKEEKLFQITRTLLTAKRRI